MKTDKHLNQFGLRESDLAYIIKTLSQFDTIEKAIIFGSRAKGNYSNGSDVDIAIKGTIDFRTLAKLSYLLNQESFMPYKFDVVNYTKTQHNDIKEHIDRIGILIYDKNILLTA
ncbi:MAG TPA: nucleotidyltransferase domain-containing protein [Epsilonproteobacteria bacterium]|nr:nucleotidyltransferase domain-containing protein [Campylobacterota bacterium]